jgi:hypothetical protein
LLVVDVHKVGEHAEGGDLWDGKILLVEGFVGFGLIGGSA